MRILIFPVLLLVHSLHSESLFREIPQNQSVIVGGTVVLRCAAHPSPSGGALYSQWRSNDGALLGLHDAGILAGHGGRYSYVKDSADENNLRIENVDVDDDGKFECQMMRIGLHPARAIAYINVIVPPSRTSLLNYRSGSIVEVKEDTELNITCVAHDAKPAASLSWYINGMKITGGIRSWSRTSIKRTITSFAAVLWKARRDDDKKILTCESTHPESAKHSRVNVTVRVLYPSDSPKIQIVSPNPDVRAGENISLICLVFGGNPPPNITWSANGKLVATDFTYEYRTKETRSVYSKVVGTEDNGVVYECRSLNDVSFPPVVSTTRLSVRYPPSSVSIYGESAVRIDQAANLRCESAPSNPNAKILWMVNDHSMRADSERHREEPDGVVTVSNLSIRPSNLPITNHEIMVECTARNEEGTISKQHLIRILSPPMKPVIYGLEGGLMNEGTVLNLTCEAHGGHPLAQLMWFRGVEKLKETRSVLSAETSRSVVTVILDRSMNSQEIRCEALNGALDEPLVTAKTVKVLFSPRRVIVRLEETSRRHVISGEPTRAFCSTSSSNPAAEILWQFSHKGAPVIARGASLYNRTSREFGGFEVENVISFTPTEDMDGSELRCVASHPLWSNSKAEVLPLRVMYPPRLVIGGPISIVVGEGDSFRENLTVKANPPVASWRWKKDGMPFDHSVGNVIVRGPLIMGRVVKGSDGGTYTLVAINSIGSANVSIHVTVEYPARVVFVTSPIIAAVGEEVVLECEAEGVPITNGMVRWLRGDTPLESVTYESPTRALLHLNASHETSGAYICTAFNNIGKANRTVAYLLVKKAPTIVRDATLMRSAGTLGSNARLKCRANAVPDVAFYWTISGASGPLRYNNSKYSFTIHQLDYSTYEGTLWISSLEQNDYQRPVKCLAMNSFGQDSTVIIVGPPSAPDPPFSLEVVNSSESSIQLSWSPGFDGGFEQIFEIRYQMSGDSVYRTMNTSDSTIEIRGLQSARRYEIAVRAINARGWVSDFSRPSIFVYTKDIDGEDVTAAEQKEAMPKHLLAAIAFGGTLLLVINIYLLCFMHRRQKRRKMQEKTEMVRKMPNGGGETVRPVQMYGAITTAENQYRPESVNTNRSDLGHDLISEDDQSVRTMIEVNPNGYIQQIDPNVFYDRDCLIEYEFDPTLYAEMRNGTLRRAPPTYSHMPYPEPPSDEVSVGAPSLTYSDTGTVPRSRDHCNTMDSPRRLHIPRIINEHTNSSSSIAGTFSAPNHNNNLGGISGSQMLSTFIQPGSGIRTTAFDYAQLDGDLV